MSTPAPSQILDACAEAAALASDHLRTVDTRGLAREEKTGFQDIVTEHDRACEGMIVARLRDLLPQARIVGEEGGARDAADQDRGAASGLTLFVDPIDGTSNFAAGLPLFCVSIGAAVDGQLVAGVVDAPLLGQVFTADDGPTRLNGRDLPPRPTRPAHQAMVLSDFPSARDLRSIPEVARQWLPRLRTEHSAVRGLGTAALELAWVAAGWADATALTSIKPWDVAAGFHLVRQAGGSVRTWPGTGNPSAPDHERPAYVACTGPERLPLLDELQEDVQAARQVTS
ncbi:inositol monophosphatase [Brachybacterium sp. EF45031]|uniref:inositol monophosphatase family protein n=1 Tax=Brachybacterium sillae TaxID=2810536 RepID=UPI00217D8288|nr:inositol monophosphatase [Brachybacterium sillae]MCS6712627.1 inositol monophosphatase [Brachybacterium sillae]